MKLHGPKFVAWFALAVLQLLVCSSLQAAPLLDLRQQDLARVRIDLRADWHTAMVPNTGAPTQQLDAQTLWALPDSQFKPGRAAPVMVKDGERFVTRLAVRVAVRVAASPNNLLLELPMPRLNLAHASYRYAGEAWTQLGAGDQVPMAKWPMVNRHPVFVIPAKAGELQVVLEIPLVGLFPSQVLLVADPAFSGSSNRP